MTTTNFNLFEITLEAKHLITLNHLLRQIRAKQALFDIPLSSIAYYLTNFTFAKRRLPT